MTFKVVRVSSKGQIVIPQEIREKYNIKEGDHLAIIPVSEDLFIIRKIVLESKLYKSFIKELSKAFNKLNINIDEETVRKALEIIIKEHITK